MEYKKIKNIQNEFKNIKEVDNEIIIELEIIVKEKIKERLCDNHKLFNEIYIITNLYLSKK